MPYFTLTDEEKERLAVAAGTSPDSLFTLVEELIEETIEWKPGRWWTVLSADGSLWCETSDEKEAWREHKERKCSTIHQQYVSTQFSKLVDKTRKSKSD